MITKPRPIIARAVRSRGGKRADLGGTYYRSTMEANWARYLRWQQARGLIRSWEYEPQEFAFPVKRGARYYLPDFRVTENDGAVTWHEVKGWMDATSKTKLRRMAKYYPDERVRIVGQSDYATVARQVGHLIPGWE